MNKYTINIYIYINSSKTPGKEAKVQEPIQRMTKPWYHVSYYSNSVATHTRINIFHLH